MSSCKIVFFCSGHPSITGTHKTTLEFTKDDSVTEEGDCIIGVSADFSSVLLKQCLIWDEILVTIEVDGLKEQVIAKTNLDFSSETEIVIRKGDFVSERTLGINADKASSDIDREIIERLKNSKAKITIERYEP